MKNKLIIADIEKQHNLLRTNCDILYLSTGKIFTNNCKIIKFKDQNLLNLKDFKKKFFLKLNKYLSLNQKYIDQDFFIESEITNIRNDKSNFFDKIYFISCLRNILKKYKFIEIIYDNNLLSETYGSFKKKNILIKCLDATKKEKFSFINFISTRFKFFLRSLIIVLFSKLFLGSQKINKEDIGLSLYPILFLKNEMNLYRNKTQLINFNISDETHIKISFFKNLKNIFFISKKNVFILEQKIFFLDLILNFLNSFFHFKIIKLIKKKKFIINKIDYSKIIFDYYLISHLNRLKLEIYKNPLKEIFLSKKVKNFHYFMFEYNFGFFLKNRIKNLNSNINFIGYQHGIFSKNLWWFDFVKQNNKEKFLPDELIANNNHSYSDYKTVLKKYIKKFYLFQAKKKKFNIKFSKLSRNYLIILGQHDHNNILKIFSNKSINKSFFVKPHPRSKPINFEKYKNLKYFNNNLSYKKVIFSQTTTMYYEFLNKKNYNHLMLIGYDYKHNISFDFIKKNKFLFF
jgi:hypothetical protein